MWILVVLILIMPFEMNPYLYISSSFLGIIPDFTVIKLVGLLGLGYSFFKIASTGVRIRILGSRQATCFFLFVFIVLLTGLLNGVVLRPLSRLISIILLLPLLLVAVRTEKDLLLALKTAVISMVLVFPYGVRQTARFGGRYGVGLYEPNYLAIALLLVIPLALVFARHDKTRARRWLWVAGGIVLLIATVLTGSRGGFVGLVIVLFFVVLKLTKHRVASFAVIGLLLATILVVVPNQLVDRLRASTDANSSARTGVEKSNEARMAEIKGGLRMVRARPLTGVGLGNFSVWMESYPDLDLGAIAHNSYLEIAAELGIPALFVFLLILLASYRSLARSAKAAGRKGATNLRDVALALQVGLLGYMSSAVFLSAHFEKYLWLVMFLTICLERVVKEGAKHAERDSMPVLESARPSKLAGAVWRHP